MRPYALSVSAIALAMTLSACGGKDDAKLEKGQVLATVNGTDVTANELNAELVGAQLPAAGEQRKSVEMQALQGLVDRTILADIARERGIDKSPIYIAQKRRAEESLLVQILQRDIASKVSPTTPSEAKSFMESNPQLFAERKIFQLDQIQFQVPQDMNKLKAYEPLKTMEEIALQLTRDGLAYRRAPGSLDPASTNPLILNQLMSKPEGEIFIIPANGALVATRIIGSKPEPLTGSKAEQFAMSAVQQKKIAAVTEKELAERIKKARESVKYQEGYAPPKPLAGAPATAAPAPTGG
ncbi:MAG: peptidyl-prolyl cis-trans isomerase, EpsD family [Pseudomonadota bacterium]|mgnify:CR=1 FL=1